MAFVRKTWKNRESEYPTRRILTNSYTQAQTRYTVERAEGTVTREGDEFSATTMNGLEERAAAAFEEAFRQSAALAAISA